MYQDSAMISNFIIGDLFFIVVCLYRKN